MGGQSVQGGRWRWWQLLEIPGQIAVAVQQRVGQQSSWQGVVELPRMVAVGDEQAAQEAGVAA